MEGTLMTVLIVLAAPPIAFGGGVHEISIGAFATTQVT